MRRTMLVCCLLAGSLTAVQRMTGQESGGKEKTTETAKAVEPPAHFYLLDFILEEVGADGKPTNSRSYTTAVSTGRSDRPGEIRTNAKIPIATGTSAQGEMTQWQYQDIGVSIDAANLRDVAGKLTVYLSADITSVADVKEAREPNYHPIVEQNRWQGQALILIGKATTVFSSDDVRSKGSMRLVVTATLLQ